MAVSSFIQRINEVLLARTGAQSIVVSLLISLWIIHLLLKTTFCDLWNLPLSPAFLPLPSLCLSILHVKGKVYFFTCSLIPSINTPTPSLCLPPLLPFSSSNKKHHQFLRLEFDFWLQVFIPLHPSLPPLHFPPHPFFHPTFLPLLSPLSPPRYKPTSTTSFPHLLPIYLML